MRKFVCSSTLPLQFGALLVSATLATAAAASDRDGSDHDKADKKSSHGKSSQLLSMAACSTGNQSSSFLADHNPFRGGDGGGTYGSMFFGNGASAVSGSSKSPDFTPAVVSAPSGGGATSPGAGGGSAFTPSVPAAGGASSVGKGGTTTAAAAGSAVGSVAGGTSAGPAAVNPEPASIILIGTGLAGVVLMRRRQGRTRTP